MYLTHSWKRIVSVKKQKGGSEYKRIEKFAEEDDDWPPSKRQWLNPVGKPKKPTEQVLIDDRYECKYCGKVVDTEVKIN